MCLFCVENISGIHLCMSHQSAKISKVSTKVSQFKLLLLLSQVLGSSEYVLKSEEDLISFELCHILKFLKYI